MTATKAAKRGARPRLRRSLHPARCASRGNDAPPDFRYTEAPWSHGPGAVPFQGIRPTGRRVEIRGADIMEISGGLIQHNTIYYDGAAFARQIGMLPSQGSRADRALISAFNAKTTLSGRYRDIRHRMQASPQ
jgi:hypothetical protein